MAPFCFVTFQVLATGLSALYSDLPSSLDIPSEDWYSLERGLWATFPELVSFLTSLEFCNNVIQVDVHFVSCLYVHVNNLARPAFLVFCDPVRGGEDIWNCI